MTEILFNQSNFTDEYLATLVQAIEDYRRRTKKHPGRPKILDTPEKLEDAKTRDKAKKAEQNRAYQQKRKLNGGKPLKQVLLPKTTRLPKVSNPKIERIPVCANGESNRRDGSVR